MCYMYVANYVTSQAMEKFKYNCEVLCVCGGVFCVLCMCCVCVCVCARTRVCYKQAERQIEKQTDRKTWIFRNTYKQKISRESETFHAHASAILCVFPLLTLGALKPLPSLLHPFTGSIQNAKIDPTNRRRYDKNKLTCIRDIVIADAQMHINRTIFTIKRSYLYRVHLGQDDKDYIKYEQRLPLPIILSVAQFNRAHRSS